MEREQENILISFIKKGDKASFDTMYDLYCSRVYNTALSYIKDVPQAEEITQDVFIKVFKNIHSFKGDSSLLTWIYRITINTSLTYVKKKKNNFLSIEEASEHQTYFQHPGVMLENKEKSELLFKVIDTLVDNQKTAFILSYVEGLRRNEVAEIMNISLKAVESLLMRAKKKLREELIKSFPERRKK